MKISFKNTKGITIVSLVITIVILLILFGVTLFITIDSNLVDKTQLAKQKTELTQLKEQVEIIKTDLILSEHENQNKLTQNDIIEKLKSNSNFTDSTVSQYENGDVVLTTSDRQHDILIKDNLNIDVFEHSSLLRGTWLFNDTITYPSNLYFEFDGVFFNKDYSFPIYSIQCNEKLGYNCFLPWYWIPENPLHPFSFGYLPENTLGFPTGWVWINIDTYNATPVTNVQLTVNSDISEVIDINGNPAGEQLLEWLQENAVKQ